MKLNGVHHITAITADAQHNVDFYAGTLGLRMVKKTVNQDQPSVYHLFYADEKGSPGADMTFFEFPDAEWAARARAWSIASAGASPPTRPSTSGSSAFRRAGTRPRGSDGGLASATPRASSTRSSSRPVDDQPLIADHPEVPGEHALQGFDQALAPTPPTPSAAARCWSSTSSSSRSMTAGRSAASDRGGTWAYDAAPDERGIQGAGTVHHIAWASASDEHEGWRERAIAGGAHPTPVIDRFWFDRSTSASRAASCSRSRRWSPASASTRTPSTSARS